ncbi:MAG: hypothetical protein V1900_03195 [Candidatus Aenigmatarchaeota archaeon]
MNPLFATMIVFLAAIMAITIVFTSGQSTIELSKETASVNEAEDAMRMLNNYIRDVVEEGDGAKRVLKLTSPDMEVSAEENAIQYRLSSGVELFEYLSRKISGDLTYISGNDVSCDDAGNLAMDNTFLHVEFQKVANVIPLSPIDTKSNILNITEKTFGRTVYPVNSSVVIDGNVSAGNGYSEILKKGKNLPLCIVHIYVNASSSYDVFYTLYAGADFLVVDVRNIS